jgi:hypothetical protein
LRYCLAGRASRRRICACVCRLLPLRLAVVRRRAAVNLWIVCLVLWYIVWCNALCTRLVVGMLHAVVPHCLYRLPSTRSTPTPLPMWQCNMSVMHVCFYMYICVS